MTTGRLPSVEGGIQPTIVDAKGDLITATAADTTARLAVGANDTVLTADSTTATGIKWAAPAGGGSNFTLINSGGTALTGASTITISGISGADKIYVIVQSASSASASSDIQLRINSDSGGNYVALGARFTMAASYASTILGANSAVATTQITLGTMADAASSSVSGHAFITGGNSSGVKPILYSGGASNFSGGDNHKAMFGGGLWNNSATVSSISLIANDNFDAGTIYVYTSA